ncbi:MAG: glycoside hydrolase [Sphingomonadales bacterium]|nr:glycoside hydrolase [Sphingomonadales bacterium]
MQLTYIAAIQMFIGFVILLNGSLRSAFTFLLVSSLFAASASIILPGLGGSSIPPVEIALIFVYLHIFGSRAGYLNVLSEAVRANRWLVVFTLFGIASAMLAPRIFADRIAVAPMRPIAHGQLVETVMLAPTAQNTTTAFYLAGTLLVALAAYVLCRACRGGIAALVETVIVIGWAHVITGIITLLAKGTPLDSIIDLVRNGSYAQLDQSYQGFVRIRGLFPEASAYAEFGIGYMVINAELWYRSIRPGATGTVAFALAVVLAFSTSSTAYVGLLGYGLFFVGRVFVMPRVVEGRRVKQFAAAAFGIIVLLAIVMALVPAMPVEFWNMILQMTVGKSGSVSGVQRWFWATQGWEAFKASSGLGIGPGSFRSSGLFFAILGSTGVIGIVSFLAYLADVFQPLRRSTWGQGRSLEQSIGGAFGTAAVLALIPAAVSSAKADPGVIFAFLSGAALALRPLVRTKAGEHHERPAALAASGEFTGEGEVQFR